MGSATALTALTRSHLGTCLTMLQIGTQCHVMAGQLGLLFTGPYNLERTQTNLPRRRGLFRAMRDSPLNRPEFVGDS